MVIEPFFLVRVRHELNLIGLSESARAVTVSMPPLKVSGSPARELKNFDLNNISPAKHYISLKVTYLGPRNKDLSNPNPTSIIESQQYPIILHGAAAATDLPRAGLNLT